MKKITLLVLLLFAAATQAQIVNIPDANFKSYLLGQAENSYLSAKDSNGNSITINANGDGEVQESEALAVWELNLDSPGANVYSLAGLEAFTNLRILRLSSVSNYVIDVLDLTPLVQLELLNIDSPSFSTINLAGLTQLSTLNIYAAAELANLNLGYHPNLTRIILDTPGISTLNLNGCPALEELNINNNPFITSLDFTGCHNLTSLSLAIDALSNLTMSNHPDLASFTLNAPPLSNLDLSGCPSISDLHISLSGWSNNSTTYVNLKNGNASYSSVNIDLNAMHNYMCIDDGEEGNLNLGASSNSIQLSSYCSFTPGGAHNTITGILNFDADNNGCTATDSFIPFASVQINDGTTTGYSYNLNGTYNFYTTGGTFTVSPRFENDWFTATPATVTFADNNNHTATQNFCVVPNGVHNDVEVVVVPIGAAQPGFEAAYKIIYKNKGNQILNGGVNFMYDGTVLTHVSASPVESSSATGNLSWNYTNLMPFESREIYISFTVNSPQETPAINIDDILSYTAVITPLTGDEVPGDNSFTLNQVVTGSYDPNDIICLEGESVHPDKIGEYLHYNINFENTGTAAASFIAVKDVIDVEEFDISTLQILSASHPMEARITNNKAEFYFNNINLAANGGKGNVVFKIKTRNTLAVNSSVTQAANIYFDYNLPVGTNDAVTTFNVLNKNEFVKDTDVVMYPNPTSSVSIIKASANIESVQLYDVQGRLLETFGVTDSNVALNLSGRANGIYFVKIRTQKGISTQKIIKQ